MILEGVHDLHFRMKIEVPIYIDGELVTCAPGILDLSGVINEKNREKFAKIYREEVARVKREYHQAAIKLLEEWRAKEVGGE